MTHSTRSQSSTANHVGAAIVAYVARSAAAFDRDRARYFLIKRGYEWLALPYVSYTQCITRSTIKIFLDLLNVNINYVVPTTGSYSA